MNREHKKKTFEKGYYKTHPCNDTFICKFCGKTVVPTGAGSNHRNHCPYILKNSCFRLGSASRTLYDFIKIPILRHIQMPNLISMSSP